MSKKYVLNFSVIFFVFVNCFIDASEESKALITEEICQYVLQMSNFSASSTSSTVNHTFAVLDDFFHGKNINTYADAAKFGRENVVFENPNEFSIKMNSLFKTNSTDIVPDNSKRYQAIVFNTSGIDVFMERLAFLKRLLKVHNIETEELIALVGSHPHREDLRKSDYLLNLPRLFSDDFDLTSFNEGEAEKNIESLNLQKSWTHRDGMMAAWQLIECDATMAEVKNKFRFFSRDGLRTEQLVEFFIEKGLDKPITQENPIAFIVNSLTASNIQEMVKQYCSHVSDAVDVLVAHPAAENIEAKLFNDTPQQRAMTKLFHFYRLLDVMLK